MQGCLAVCNGKQIFIVDPDKMPWEFPTLHSSTWAQKLE